jgi:hypothetical protein
MMPSKRTRPDTEKDITFSSDTSVHNELAKHAISSSYKLRNDCEGYSSIREIRETDVILNQGRVFPKPMLLMKQLNPSFMHTVLTGFTKRRF